MATAPAVYKQNKVIFSVAGIPVEDIAEDEEITINYDRDRISKQLDIGKGGIFSVRDGNPATIEVPILQHSKWISILTNYKKLDKMVAISLEDKNDYNNTAMFVSAHAMIQNVPVSYGSEASSRTFVFEIMHLEDIIIPEL
ncbi:MAG: hypothetical protein RR744_00050 [Cellulosilyticaceae bacterium]